VSSEDTTRTLTPHVFLTAVFRQFGPDQEEENSCNRSFAAPCCKASLRLSCAYFPGRTSRNFRGEWGLGVGVHSQRRSCENARRLTGIHSQAAEVCALLTIHTYEQWMNFFQQENLSCDPPTHPAGMNYHASTPSTNPRYWKFTPCAYSSSRCVLRYSEAQLTRGAFAMQTLTFLHPLM
jgi:hypothetical protein